MSFKKVSSVRVQTNGKRAPDWGQTRRLSRVTGCVGASADSLGTKSGSSGLFLRKSRKTAGMTAEVESTWPSPEELYEQYFPQVFRLSLRLTANRSDAEDLAQEVFLKLLNTRPADMSGSTAGWIHRVTTNLFLDGVRRKKRRPETLIGEHHDFLVSREPLPDSFVHDAAFDPDIEAALAAIPHNMRIAVILSDVEQLSAEEISAALGIKVATVRTRVHRGRVQLRKELAHRAPKDGRTRVGGPAQVASSS